MVKLPHLEILNLAYNFSLANLNLQNNQKLRELNVHGTKLNNLNLSHLTKLEALNVDDSKLTELNINGCQSLINLDCRNNELTGLDLSNCPKLEKISNRTTEQEQELQDKKQRLAELEREWSSEEREKFDKYIKKLPQKERVKEALSELLRATEDLPKSINSDEMQRMEKEAKEGLFQALWEYWKVDKLKEKVDKFLKTTEEEPHEVIEDKLNASLKELESIKNLYPSVNSKQRKKLKILENQLKVSIDGLQQNLSDVRN